MAFLGMLIVDPEEKVEKLNQIYRVQEMTYKRPAEEVGKSQNMNLSVDLQSLFAG